MGTSEKDSLQNFLFTYSINSINALVCNMKLTCKRSILKQDLLFLLSACVYRIGLDIIYVQCISPFFDYQNFFYEPELWSTLAAGGIFVFFALRVLSFLRDPNSVVSIAAVLFFFISVVPFTSLLACKTQPVGLVLSQFVYWFLTYGLLASKKTFHVPLLRSGSSLVTLLTIVMAMTVVFISGYYTGFRMNFSLLNVYDVRMEVRELNIPILLVYLWAPMANVLPFILVILLEKRKWLLALGVVFIIFLNFSINGLKSVLFKMFFALYLFYFFRNKNILGKIHYLFVGLIVIVLLEWCFYESIFISSLLIRRVLFMPALLDGLFYDYILENGPIYYGKQAAEITFNVGGDYFGSKEMNANNGMFTDAFVNLGYWGCLVYPCIYAVFFKLCDSAFRGHNNQVIFFATLLIVTTMLSSFFTVALLTHGLFLLCLTVYMFPRNKQNTYHT